MRLERGLNEAIFNMNIELRGDWIEVERGVGIWFPDKTRTTVLEPLVTDPGNPEAQIAYCKSTCNRTYGSSLPMPHSHLLGWHVCRTKLHRKVCNFKTKWHTKRRYEMSPKMLTFSCLNISPRSMLQPIHRLNH